MTDISAHQTPQGTLTVHQTERFHARVRKVRLEASPALAAALRNARYGYDPVRSRSRGGRDGIFRIDRDHRPANTMMRKLFNGFIDRDDPLAAAIEAQTGVPRSAWIPVRLVHHHVRLLGVMTQVGARAELFLVDVDDGE